MESGEPFPGFTIQKHADSVFYVYQRTAEGDHERIGSADSYEDACESASAYATLLQDAWS